MSKHQPLKEKCIAEKRFMVKMNPACEIELLKRIAWYWSSVQIKKYFKEEIGKNLDYSTIKRYRESEKWKSFLNRERDQYNLLVLQVPLANKRMRLDEYQKQYDVLDNETPRKRYERREILKEVRQEIEIKSPDSVNLTMINHTEYHNMSDEELQNEKVKTLNKLEQVRKLKLLTGGKDASQDTGSEEIDGHSRARSLESL